jgi:hypothetical protein
MTAPTDVSVRLPIDVLKGKAGGPSGEDQWKATLHQLLWSLSSGLQPASPPNVDVVASDDELAVTIGERPALVGSSTSASSSDGVLDRLTQRLIRRPDLLSGQPGRNTSVQAYLADLGLAPARADLAGGRPGIAVHQLAEDVIDSLEPDEIVIEAPAEILQRTTDAGLDLVSRLRHQSLIDFGLMLPDMRLRPTFESTNGVVWLRLNDLSVPVHSLSSDSGWSDVVDVLVRAIIPRRHWFLRRRDVRSSLSDLGYLMPDLVQSCLDCYPLPTVAAVLREMARGGRSIRNLGRLAWLLLDVGSGAEAGADRFAFTETPQRVGEPDSGSGPQEELDPVVLAALLRKALNEEWWRIGTFKVPQHAGRLSADTEQLLKATSDGDDRSELAAAEWRALSELSELDQPQLLVVREAAAIPPVAGCVQALPDPPRVVSSQELPPDADLTAIPVAGRRFE